MHPFTLFKKACALWVAGACLCAHAQSPIKTDQPSTGSTRAHIHMPVSTPLAYVSPLAGYQRYSETSVQDWNTVNQTVHHIGGWRAYLQEAQPGAGAHRHGAAATTPSPNPAATPSAQRAPAASAHQGH